MDINTAAAAAHKTDSIGNNPVFVFITFLLNSISGIAVFPGQQILQSCLKNGTASATTYVLPPTYTKCRAASDCPSVVVLSLSFDL